MMLSLLALLALLQGDPTAECRKQIETMAPALEKDGFALAKPEGDIVLRAIHSEPAGRILIDYRCTLALKSTIVNEGLPTIPFKVLLAAGLDAKVEHAMPDWLRARYEAVKD